MWLIQLVSSFVMPCSLGNANRKADCDEAIPTVWTTQKIYKLYTCVYIVRKYTKKLDITYPEQQKNIKISSALN